jgi:hypothetical protein
MVTEQRPETKKKPAATTKNRHDSNRVWAHARIHAPYASGGSSGSGGGSGGQLLQRTGSAGLASISRAICRWYG